NDDYLEVLSRHLESWMQTNPPEFGVHWYSNLEISLRALAWLQILALVGDRLDSEIRAEMWRHLYHSGRHLTADLPYTVSTMRNNHLLGDALGLIALGTAFGGRAGQRWVSIGNRIFDQQLARHMRRDGSMIEDSVSYHRFVLEMLSMRVVLGGESPEVLRAMTAAAQFLARLGALEGSVPQYGDWDEGRLFAVSEDPTDLAGSVRLALALAGDGAPEEWRAAHDEVAWFAGEGTPVSPDAAETSGGDIGAGIGRTTVGPFTVWLKGGSGPSHGHADLSSVSIAHDGRWLIGDPGTGTYNGPLEERNYFRGSRSHDVLRVDGEDQLVPHRAFRWAHQADGAIGDPIRFGDTVVMWTVHDAYTRLSPPRRVVRVVTVSPRAVEVVDHVEGPPASVDLTLPLHPQATWNETASTIELDGESFALELPLGDMTTTRCGEDPYAGWWSDTYGSAEPATVIDIRADSGDPIKWVVRSLDDSGPNVRSGDGHEPVSTVLLNEAGVRLRVEIDGRTFLRSI
ncbi:MAG: heparinase II/III family protein, partial [Actinomycetota bacterium]|nr:heparinase II/III family protein [Actinomycetota bacterium]